MVLWKPKQKEWCANHMNKEACGKGNGIVEGNSVIRKFVLEE